MAKAAAQQQKKPNKKADAFSAGMMAGVQAERAVPAVSVQERLRRADSVANPTGPGEARIVEKVVEKLVAVPERVRLEEIRDRASNIRVVNESRAKRFAVSIALVGLIQPPAIDRNSRLLAGDHRRRALTILREVSESPEKLAELLPEVAILPDGSTEEATATHESVKGKVLSAWRRFAFDGGVPVHRMDLDSETEPELAKSIEATENFQREDFTKDEVKAAYLQLKDAGFREPEPGRPKAGTKPIRPELALLFGKAERTISRYLAEVRAEGQGAPPPSADPAIIEAEKKLKEAWPTSKLNVSRTGAWQLVIRGKTRKELDELVASIQTST